MKRHAQKAGRKELTVNWRKIITKVLYRIILFSAASTNETIAKSFRKPKR